MSYPAGDLARSGGQAIVRAGRRRDWLFGKAVWVGCTVAGYCSRHGAALHGHDGEISLHQRRPQPLQPGAPISVAPLSLCASLFTRNRFAVLLAPFLAYMFFYALGTTTLQLAACPAGFLRPSQLFVPRWPWLLGELALLLAGGAGFFDRHRYKKGWA